ncbi:MAG: ABC transporter ATP-binding protein [Burkholderiales bacterium]
MTQHGAIDVRGLAKRFGKLQALDHIDLRIEQGEFFGLLGPNGAGKTTLISIIAGLTRADAGEARVMGHDVVVDYRAARRALGVVPQELVFDPFLTVRETLEFQAGYYGARNSRAWIEEVIECLDLGDKANINMRALSGGMKRRVLVGQALVHKPPVIILDEPTAGVDVELRMTLWKFIRRLNAEGHTIVLTTHYLDEAESLCGRIAMLNRGRIVALDRTDALMKMHHSLNLRVRLADAPPPAALLSRRVANVDDVHTFALDRFDDVESTLASLRTAHCRVLEMELLQPDLEEIFVEIMRTDTIRQNEEQR